MKDHLLQIDEILVKYNIPGIPRQVAPLLDHSDLNRGRKVKKNQVFPVRDHNILFLLEKAIFNPVTVVSLVSVTALVIVYFFNKEEKEHLLVFIFTVSILIIFIAFELFEEIRINNIYRKNLKMLESRIIIDDHAVSINSDYLQEGDILYLKAGDTVGADSILIDSSNFSVDRKKMIGEHKVIAKDHRKFSNVFEDSENVVLGSDYVLTGSAKAVVVRVGKNSKIGQLYNQFKKSSLFKSKIETEISVVFYVSLAISFVISSIFSIFALLNGAGVFDLVNLIFSTFLCIIPECIPNTVKILQLAVTRKLNNKGLVVRDVDIVERMGLVTMICADKKTLIPPENIFVGSVYDGWKVFDIELTFSDQDSEGLDFLRRMSHVISYVSREKKSTNKKYYHESLEAFSDVLNGYFIDYYGSEDKKSDFTFHGLDVTVVEHMNFKTAYVLGSVESILKICTNVHRAGKRFKLRSARKNKIQEITNLFKNKGYKCLALASRSYSKLTSKYSLKGCQLAGVIFLEEMPIFDTPIFTNVIKSSGISFSIVSESEDRNQLFSCFNILGFADDEESGEKQSLGADKNEKLTESYQDSTKINYSNESGADNEVQTNNKYYTEANTPYKSIVKNDLWSKDVHTDIKTTKNDVNSLIKKRDLPEEIQKLKSENIYSEIGKNASFLNKKAPNHTFAKSEIENSQGLPQNNLPSSYKDLSGRSLYIQKRIKSYNSSSMPNLTFLNSEQNQKLVSFDPSEASRTRSMQEYSKLSNKERFEILKNDNFIIYNCRNSHKKDIVHDLEKINHVVCFVGLDINDAEALSAADVGICFSSSGLIGQESSNVVIDTLKFSHILTYIEEGRLFYINLKKSIKYILMHVTPQLMALSMYAFLGTPPPISSIMLLLLNYLVEMIPASYFAYEEPEYNLMVEQPSNKKDVSEMPTILNISGNNTISRTAGFIKKISYVMTNGAIYHLNTITWSIIIAGLLSSASCIAAFLYVFIIEEVPLRSLFFDVRNYFVHGGQDLLLKNGEIIGYESQLEILHKAQCTFFVGMMICQFFNMLVCRREREYFFYKFFNNPRILIFTSLGILVSLLIVCSTVFDNFLLLKRPVILPLIFPFISSLFILLIDTGKKYIAKLYKES